MRKVSQFVLAISICAAACAAAAEVRKEKVPGKYTTTVRYSDLNLETDQGVKRLYSRLRIAANEVCGVRKGLVVLEVRVSEERCVRGAIDDAVTKVNRPQLTAYHRAKARGKDDLVLSQL